MGALANEGGLNRRDFGHISIRPDFSLVELPAELPPGTAERLAGTRISGKLIELRRDDGPPGKRPQAAPQEGLTSGVHPTPFTSLRQGGSLALRSGIGRCA